MNPSCPSNLSKTNRGTLFKKQHPPSIIEKPISFFKWFLNDATNLKEGCQMSLLRLLCSGWTLGRPDSTEWVNPHKVGSIPSDIGSHRPSTQYNPPGGWDLISFLAFHRLRWDRFLHSFHSHYIFRYAALGTSSARRY
jgi:hypothetical protein